MQSSSTCCVYVLLNRANYKHSFTEDSDLPQTGNTHNNLHEGWPCVCMRACVCVCVCAGLVSVSSFRGGDSSYSMWIGREPSTWSEPSNHPSSESNIFSLYESCYGYCDYLPSGINYRLTPMLCLSPQADSTGGENYGSAGVSGSCGPPESVGLCGLADS